MKRWAFLSSLALLALGVQAPASAPADYRMRAPQDEVVYFVLPDRFANGDPKNDRGGIKGDRLKTGFDPAHKETLYELLGRLRVLRHLGHDVDCVEPRVLQQRRHVIGMRAERFADLPIGRVHECERHAPLDAPLVSRPEPSPVLPLRG